MPWYAALEGQQSQLPAQARGRRQLGWLILKAESCKAKISEWFQRGLTVGGTHYYNHRGEWRSDPILLLPCTFQILISGFSVSAPYSWPPEWTLLRETKR